MLGEQLAEERGQVIGTRVLPSENGPKTEVTFQAQGTILGIDQTDIGTYTSVLRPNGTLVGEGQGIIMTPEGDTATWKGEGVGRFIRPGVIAYRGAVYYETSSERLAAIDGTCAVFEYEVDESGKTEGKLWRWK
jgi:hypothetical protein